MSSARTDAPSDGPLFPVLPQKSYLTWEPDMGGLNNIRLQASPASRSAASEPAISMLPSRPEPFTLSFEGPLAAGDAGSVLCASQSSLSNPRSVM